MKKIRVVEKWVVGKVMVVIMLLVWMLVGSMAVVTEWAWAEEVENLAVPEIYIRAVNPGYTVDGKSNVGEMIEIAQKNSDNKQSLAGVTVRYTNTSGNETTLLAFPDNSYLTGEVVVLRLASSPGSELANLNYGKTIAMKGGLALMRGEEVLDAVCWTGKEGCYKEFMSAHPTSLARDETTGGFEHREAYEPKYRAEWYEMEVAKEEEGYGAVKSQCRGMKFSEILSYYETNKSEQFIELHNMGAEQVLLDGCQIRYKNKNYGLTGMVQADGYMVYYPTEFSLTKNPTNGNKLELIDTDGAVVDELNYPNGQRKGTAYAWIGYDEKGEALWRVTYAPTPGAENNYQEYKTCEEGKVINEATGNCVKVTAVTEKICPEGQYLNILTGRCKKYETAATKTCKEGYYLNPETGRCRKIIENEGTNYGVQSEEFEEKPSFVALYAVIGVAAVGVGYLIYEFRGEIVRLWRRVWR